MAYQKIKRFLPLLLLVGVWSSKANAQEAILQEMEQLLALPPDVLNAQTMSALQSRLEMFGQMEVRMNLRGGIF